MTLLDAAIRYAARGWPVFPLAVRGKMPLIAKADGGRGFHDATTDTDQIREWWTRWLQANIGIASGHGFDVLDVDTDHGGEETLAALEAEHGPLPATVKATTGSGGRHILFLPDARVRCSAGRLGPGLDVRGRSGYVVAPPSIHPSGRGYRWSVRNAPLAPWPPWLLVLAVPAEAARPQTMRQTRPPLAAGGSHYGVAVLRRACATIAAAGEGTRHDTLLRCACGVSSFVAGGEIAEDLAREHLIEAARECGLPHREAADMWTWAVKKGSATPRVAPSREQP
jgi:hypothetical protein